MTASSARCKRKWRSSKSLMFSSRGPITGQILRDAQDELQQFLIGLLTHERACKNATDRLYRTGANGKPHGIEPVQEGIRATGLRRESPGPCRLRATSLQNG